MDKYELFTIAHNLLSAYVLPGKAFDVLELCTYQAALSGKEKGESINYYQLKVDSIKAAASALHDAQEELNKEALKGNIESGVSNGYLPVNYGEMEIEF